MESRARYAPSPPFAASAAAAATTPHAPHAPHTPHAPNVHTPALRGYEALWSSFPTVTILCTLLLSLSLLSSAGLPPAPDLPRAAAAPVSSSAGSFARRLSRGSGGSSTFAVPEISPELTPAAAAAAILAATAGFAAPLEALLLRSTPTPPPKERSAAAAAAASAAALSIIDRRVVKPGVKPGSVTASAPRSAQPPESSHTAPLQPSTPHRRRRRRCSASSRYVTLPAFLCSPSDFAPSTTAATTRLHLRGLFWFASVECTPQAIFQLVELALQRWALGWSAWGTRRD